MTNSDIYPLSDEKNEEARYGIVQKQSGLPLKESRNILFAALGDASWRVRKKAVEILLSEISADEDLLHLIELLRDEDNAGLRNAAIELLSRLDKKSVNFLLRYLDDDDHDLRKQIVDILGTISGEEALAGLVRALSDKDVNVASAAAEGLGAVGDKAAVSVLIDRLESAEDPFFQFNVLAALGRIGVAGPLPPVIRQLAGHEMLRRAVYECLGKIGADLDAVDLLVEGLFSQLPSLSQAAISSLSQVLKRLEPAEQQEAGRRLRKFNDYGMLERLTSSVSADNLLLNEAIVNLLGVIADSRGSVALFKLLSDERLAPAASRVLKSLGKDVVTVAIDSWNILDSDETRAALCRFMGTLKESRCTVAISQAFDDASPIVRAAAVEAAGYDEAVFPPLLIKLLFDEDAAVRGAAIKALNPYSARYSAMINAAAEKLALSQEPEKRKEAASIFSSIQNVDAIAILLKDEEPIVREAACRAAGEIKDNRSCHCLLPALMDEDADVRISAAEALSVCNDAEAIPPLRLLIKDEDPWVQATALRTLVKLAGNDSLPEILESWSTGSEILQLACIDACDLLGTHECLVPISEDLGNHNGDVLKGAIRLLHRHDYSLLLPWFSHILCHPDWDVRLTAVKATDRLEPEQRISLLKETLEYEDYDLVKAEIRSLLFRNP